MAQTALEAVVTQLKVDEGFRAVQYMDSRGIPTIGYGTSLEAWSPQFAEAVLRLTLSYCVADLAYALPWASDLDQARYGVLIQLRYNLGLAGLLEFQRMLGHLQRGEFPQAGLELIVSTADHQEPARMARWAQTLTTGAT